MLLDIIYPPTCGICGEINKKYICKKCEIKIKQYEINKIDNTIRYLLLLVNPIIYCDALLNIPLHSNTPPIRNNAIKKVIESIIGRSFNESIGFFLSIIKSIPPKNSETYAIDILKNGATLTLTIYIKNIIKGILSSFHFTFGFLLKGISLVRTEKYLYQM